MANDGEADPGTDPLAGLRMRIAARQIFCIGHAGCQAVAKKVGMNNDLDLRLGRLEEALSAQRELLDRLLAMVPQILTLMQQRSDGRLSTLLAELVASENAKTALLERIERSLVVGAG